MQNGPEHKNTPHLNSLILKQKNSKLANITDQTPGSFMIGSQFPNGPQTHHRSTIEPQSNYASGNNLLVKNQGGALNNYQSATQS